MNSDLGQFGTPSPTIYFPVLSTIQTRLRYMLFVPWIYTMAEEDGSSPDHLMEWIRGREDQRSE